MVDTVDMPTTIPVTALSTEGIPESIDLHIQGAYVQLIVHYVGIQNICSNWLKKKIEKILLTEMPFFLNFQEFLIFTNLKLSMKTL